MWSLQTKRHCKRGIYLAKTLFQLHDNLRYSGSEITFFRKAPTNDWNIFQSRQMENVVAKYIVSIKFFLHSETQKREVFQDDFLHENIPTSRRLQESDSTCKGTKISCIWDGVFVTQIAVLVWIHFLLTCRQYEAFQKPAKSENKALVSAMHPRQWKPLKTWRH